MTRIPSATNTWNKRHKMDKIMNKNLLELFLPKKMTSCKKINKKQLKMIFTLLRSSPSDDFHSSNNFQMILYN